MTPGATPGGTFVGTPPAPGFVPVVEVTRGALCKPACVTVVEEPNELAPVKLDTAVWSYFGCELETLVDSKSLREGALNF